MLDAQIIDAYLAQRRRIAAAAADPASGFQGTRREQSEGLCRTCTVDDEVWTYATQTGGYAFTSPTSGASVFVPDDPARLSSFTAAELVPWLQAQGGHDRLNGFVLDSLLMRAEIGGLVEQVPDQRGQWRLR